jgi:thioredoxin reductase (NADPH)
MTQSQPQRTDVVIVGAGPVGLFAVFERGMLNMRPIYDIPGYPCISAGELIGQLCRQAAPFQPVYHLGQQVVSLARGEGEGWRLETSAGTVVEARAVVVAAGCGAFGPNRPPLPGIEDYEGHSVFYLVERREAFRDKRVVIAGGGDSAVDWALNLTDLAGKVYVVHRRDKFRAAPESVHRMRALALAEPERLELVIPYQLHGLEGHDDRLEAVLVSTLKGEIRRLEADVLLPFFGLSMDLGPIAEWGLDLERSHIAVDPATSQTSRPGIFAIGDIAGYPGKLKLILSGFAEAALAAHAIHPLVHPGEELHWEYSTTKGLPGAEAEEPASA